jgi:G3E family GTPase
MQSNMVDSIETLLAKFEETPECILIESSGVADPGGIVRGLRNQNLQPKVRVENVIGMLDAAQIDGLDHRMAQLARRQLAAAYLVINNKTDLVAPEQLAAVKEKWLFPRSRAIETTYANVPFELIFGVGCYDPLRHLGCDKNCDHDHNSYHHSHDRMFETWSWTHAKALDTKRFQQFVKDLPKSVYRAKGFVHLADTPDQRAVLHVVGTRQELNMEPSPVGTEPGTQLVFIGEKGRFNAAEIQQQLETTCLRL